jgi:hypothetical protein
LVLKVAIKTICLRASRTPALVLGFVVSSMPRTMTNAC